LLHEDKTIVVMGEILENETYWRIVATKLEDRIDERG
jgi:hypothetical protein